MLARLDIVYVSNYYQLFGIRTMIQVGLLLLSRIRTKKKRLDDFTSSSRLLHRDCRKKRLAIHAHRRLAPLAHEHPRAMPLPTFLKAPAVAFSIAFERLLAMAGLLPV